MYDKGRENFRTRRRKWAKFLRRITFAHPPSFWTLPTCRYCSAISWSRSFVADWPGSRCLARAVLGLALLLCPAIVKSCCLGASCRLHRGVEAHHRMNAAKPRKAVWSFAATYSERCWTRLSIEVDLPGVEAREEAVEAHLAEELGTFLPGKPLLAHLVVVVLPVSTTESPCCLAVPSLAS